MNALKPTQRFQVVTEDVERARELEKPLQPTPAHLLKPTRVKVLRGFCVNGKPVQVGSVITLEWHDAVSMIALKKAVLV